MTLLASRPRTFYTFVYNICLALAFLISFTINIANKDGEYINLSNATLTNAMWDQQHAVVGDLLIRTPSSPRLLFSTLLPLGMDGVAV